MRHARPCAGHPRLSLIGMVKAWMAGTSPAIRPASRSTPLSTLSHKGRGEEAADRLGFLSTMLGDLAVLKDVDDALLDINLDRTDRRLDLERRHQCTAGAAMGHRNRVLQQRIVPVAHA